MSENAWFSYLNLLVNPYFCIPKNAFSCIYLKKTSCFFLWFTIPAQKLFSNASLKNYKQRSVCNSNETFLVRFSQSCHCHYHLRLLYVITEICNEWQHRARCNARSLITDWDRRQITGTKQANCSRLRFAAIVECHVSVFCCLFHSYCAWNSQLSVKAYTLISVVYLLQ